MEILSSVKLNKPFSISDFSPSLNLNVKRRLFDLGFVKGTKIKVLRKSLLGRAFLVEIRGYCLTIKRDIASSIMVD